jgi:hypothetical protein
MESVGDWLSGAGAILLWSVAAIVACILFEAACNGLGWLTQRLLQVNEPDQFIWRGRSPLSKES